MKKNSNLLQNYQDKIYEQQRRINATIEKRQDNLDSGLSTNNKKLRRVADTFNTLVHDHNQWTHKLTMPMNEDSDMSMIHPPQYKTINFDDINENNSDSSMVDASDSAESKSTPENPSKEGNTKHD